MSPMETRFTFAAHYEAEFVTEQPASSIRRIEFKTSLAPSTRSELLVHVRGEGLQPWVGVVRRRGRTIDTQIDPCPIYPFEGWQDFSPAAGQGHSMEAGSPGLVPPTCLRENTRAMWRNRGGIGEFSTVDGVPRPER